jgi:hypothetical protein
MDDVEFMQPKKIPELPPEPTGPLAWLATTLGAS